MGTQTSHRTSGHRAVRTVSALIAASVCGRGATWFAPLWIDLLLGVSAVLLLAAACHLSVSLFALARTRLRQPAAGAALLMLAAATSAWIALHVPSLSVALLLGSGVVVCVVGAMVLIVNRGPDREAWKSSGVASPTR